GCWDWVEGGDAVGVGGGIPMGVPPVEGETAGLDVVAGLILPGGGDVDPSHYGGDRHDANYGISQERDRFELALARAAIARPSMPVLCVCRGMQLLNVALGGDLIAHIPDEFGTSVVHRAPQLDAVPRDVRLDPQRPLARVLPPTEFTVQSVHHQAVGRLGDGLRAVAWAEDGVIEAVETDRHAFLIGVQWHPERDALGNPRPTRPLGARGACPDGYCQA